jgi:hypothetical protein
MTSKWKGTKGFENHFKDVPLAKMTHIVAAIKGGTWATPDWAHERRMAVMEVTEHLMDLHDRYDGIIQSSIRGWVGEIQRLEGIE